MVPALSGGQITEVDDSEVDFELESPNAFFGSHVNLIPMHSAVQAPRLFYGARFYNQSLPLVSPEAPLVRNLADGDPEGRSFDELYGKAMGAVFADDDAEVDQVGDTSLTLRLKDGTKKDIELYRAFPFNRKTQITQTSGLKKGDRVAKGQLLAKSNYTDDAGAAALGANARVGLVAFKGYSMDDAVAVSEAFAKRLTSDHSYTHSLDFDHEIKGGLGHFRSLFPTKFKKEQLAGIGEDGVVKPGTVVHAGDPLVLATRPRSFSSTTSQLGKLSKAMRQSRHDASLVWDDAHPGTVMDVAKTKTGYKVVVSAQAPAEMGDKIVLRSGQKGIISAIVPDAQMPRTVDGKPLEVLLNQLGIPSRVNNSLIYELSLGKAAEKLGAPIKVPAFNKAGERWYDIVDKYLGDAGLSATEEVFDPMTNRKLDQPIHTGIGHVLKLHHVAASKSSARGQGSYDSNEQPAKGGGEMAQSKRLSGLETHVMLSSGAYKNLKEGATLRGQKNDEYWRDLRSGYRPKPPGEPFVWGKFQALLAGAGINARKMRGGKLRLGPFTDKELDERGAAEIKTGELVDMHTLDPVKGGLFDQSLVGNNRWGKIKLPFKVPNPAFEEPVRHLLGLTKRELRAILAGEMELPEHLR